MCRQAAALAAAVIALAAGPAAAQIVSSMHAQHVAYGVSAWSGHREWPGQWSARSNPLTGVGMGID